MTVIAMASGTKTVAWVRSLGAHHVVIHSKPLAKDVTALGIGAVASPAFIHMTAEADPLQHRPSLWRS
jgi:NADPH2:quinone reductase